MISEDKAQLKESSNKPYHIHKDEEYEKKILGHNKYKNMILKALDIVREYILKNDRILVGGMAVNILLLRKGYKLYDEDKTLPDYDFISPEFHTDSYNIAMALHKKKFPNAQSINGRHKSTMRVRVNFQAVADCTYMPKNIYDILPTIRYRGFRLIHPHYQMIDQHKALSLPYEDIPLDNFNSRWRKDMGRNNLLQCVYPIRYSNGKLPNRNNYSFSLTLIQNQCIAGFPALEYWLTLAKKMDRKFDFMLSMPDLNISRSEDSTTSSTEYTTFSIDNGVIKCDVFGSFAIYSDHPKRITNVMANIIKKNIATVSCNMTYYNSIAEKLPPRVVINCERTKIDDFTYNNPVIEIFDNLYNLVGARRIEDSGISLYIINLQAIIVYMLTFWIIYGKREYLYGYCTARNIVKWASKKYSEGNNKEKYLPFLPTVEIFGSKNVGINFIMHRRKFMNVLKDIKYKEPIPSSLYSNRMNSKKIDEVFEYKPYEHKIYQYDGLKTDNIVHEKIEDGLARGAPSNT